MYCKKCLALCAVVVLAVLASCSAALASGPKVTVRVEGKNRTLLAPTQVSTPSGSIKKGGAPSGLCPGASAAGALDAATHHRWSASFSTKYQALFLTAIFGERYGSTASTYWGVWVNDRYASSGICGIQPQRGQQLLFAAVPITGNPYPLGLHGPRHVTRGHSYTVKVVYYNAKGVAKPLAGVRVRGAGGNAVSNQRGIVSLTASKTGRISLQASCAGYIRSAPVSLTVQK